MQEPIILKIFLIGCALLRKILSNISQIIFFHCSFHHKKGWILDKSFPEKCSVEMDMEHLPTLCLPDQSHNFESDSVYFVLPNKELNDKKVFGMRSNVLICDSGDSFILLCRRFMFPANLARQAHQSNRER